MSVHPHPGDPEDLAARVAELLAPRLDLVVRDAVVGSPTPPRALQVKEVAAALSTSVRSVWTLIEAGELAVVYISPRQPRVHADVLDAFLRRKAAVRGGGRR